MTPVAVLPAAALLLRLGAGDVLDLNWMAAAGGAIFDNLALLFAIGIAIGLAEENNGVAGLAGAVGYSVSTKVAVTFDQDNQHGGPGWNCSWVLSAHLYNKYKAIKVPDFLGFFGGKRFVPILILLYALTQVFWPEYGWPLVQKRLVPLEMPSPPLVPAGGPVFGLLNRLLIPLGLHHVINSFAWFQFGEFVDAAGKRWSPEIFTGSSPAIRAAGVFMTGFFPIVMCGFACSVSGDDHHCQTGKPEISHRYAFRSGFHFIPDRNHRTHRVPLHVPGAGPLCGPCVTHWNQLGGDYARG